jgi:hypothetical protein
MQDIDLDKIQEEVKAQYAKSMPNSVKALADYNRDQNDLRVGTS